VLHPSGWPRPFTLRGVAGGRPLARRRCFVCGVSPQNSAGIIVAACTISRGVWRGPAGHSRRQTISSSLSIGLCEYCLDEAMRDGRIYRSPVMRQLIGGKRAVSGAA
jgi:hypothetical protein